MSIRTVGVLVLWAACATAQIIPGGGGGSSSPPVPPTPPPVPGYEPSQPDSDPERSDSPPRRVASWPKLNGRWFELDGDATSEREEYREELQALLRSRRRHPANPKPVEPKPAPTERVIGIPHSRNTFLGDRIA